ncbi:MAG: ribonuclease E/G, partial [Clostridia bacterium]|nr:ribonuclease E/G [Clostridia bacterium]
MSKQILMEVRNGQREIALLDGKRLLAFFQDTGGGVEAEQIYFGVVDRIVKGMEACFVRLGKDQMGFLPFSECKEKPRSGDRLAVQVKKPPIGDKAPYLTADVALAGRYVILTPFTTRFGVSQKITDESERARLRQTAEKIAPEGMGLVMRTESADAAEEDMAADVNVLSAAWNEIQEKQK